MRVILMYNRLLYEIKRFCVMNKKYLLGLSVLLASSVFASEVPLCALPLLKSAQVVDNAKTEGDKDPGCAAVYSNALSVLKQTNSKLSLANDSAIPAQLTVGTVYLQPISMAPAGMMRQREKSDIHLEIDIHAKSSLKSRGFAPGDWLPNANISYSIQKIGSDKPIVCGTKANKALTTCPLMAMVASDGPHYGDNVKLDGAGFYVATFSAKSNPMMFGWHTDTDSKILGTEYVDWKFKQSYLFKFTGVGKKGGY